MENMIVYDSCDDLIFACFENFISGNRSMDISLPSLVEEMKKTNKIWSKYECDLKKETEKARFALNNNDKEGYDAIKKMLPAISTNAYYPDTRGQNSQHTSTGIFMLDFDHIENPDNLLYIVKKIACVILACKSLSNKGFHILIKHTPISDEDFTICYQASMIYFETLLGAPADKACKNINRLMIINHDPDVYYNPKAIPLDMTGALWIEKNPFNHFNINQDMDQREKFSKYCDIAAPNMNWNRGNRHFSLVSLASNANKAGFDENVVITECIRRYAESDFDDKEIRETISDVYKRYSSDHSSNQKAFIPKTDKRTKGQIDTSQNTEEDLLDEDELLTAKYPDVEEVRQYIPAAFYDYIIDNNKSKEINFTTLISVLVAMGAVMKGVKCLMRRGEVVTTFIYYLVCGAAASGKSCIDKGYKFFKIHKDIIENESREEYKKKKEEYKKWEKCQKNCKEEDCGCGAEPIIPKIVKILMSLNISASKLIHQLFDNGPIPSLLYTTELDSFLNIKENPLSPVLRAAYEGEPLSSHTHMHGDVAKDNTQMSITAAGTPLQVAAFFKNKEDGLVSRFISNFLPDLPYEGLDTEGDCDFNSNKEAEESFFERVKTFIKYALNLILILNLTPTSRKMIDAYFMIVEKRYARYNSPALLSFIRRLRKIDIRLAMILTVLWLFDKIEVHRSYDIPDEIISLVISWNDFWIEQHIRLLSLLPDEEDKPTSNELKYAHVYKSLPCDFDFSSAKAIFNEKAGVSDKTAQRTLKTWVKKELLTQKLQRYYKTDCKECPPQEQTSMC